MSKHNKFKIFLGVFILFFLAIPFFLVSCSFNVSSFKEDIDKVIKNFRDNFSRYTYETAIVSYGEKHKNYDHLEYYFCKKNSSENVKINGGVYLAYLPNRDVYIDNIGKNGDQYTFRCYFKNIPEKGTTIYASYIIFSMSGTDFKSVTVDSFYDFRILHKTI